MLASRHSLNARLAAGTNVAAGGAEIAAITLDHRGLTTLHTGLARQFGFGIFGFFEPKLMGSVPVTGVGPSFGDLKIIIALGEVGPRHSDPVG